MKGPKGIVLFMVERPNANKTPPAVPPSQNENKNAARDAGQPRINETASVNFASPNPIHVPREKNQRHAKNNEKRSAKPTSRNAAFSRILPTKNSSGKRRKKSAATPRRNKTKNAESGMIFSFRSTTKMTIAAEIPTRMRINTTAPRSVNSARSAGRKRIAEAAKRSPAASSTRGCSIENLPPHPRHFPRWMKKLKIGTSSRAVKTRPHDSQCERPKSDSPRIPRRITTFRKLPTARPNRKMSAAREISTL